MGLDMYLNAKRYFFDKDSKEAKKLQKIEDCPFSAQSVEYEIGYWRKSNAIHKWFVDNVQEGNDDCGTYYVTEEKLQLLLDEVNSALNAKDPSKILPTQGGFFFGATEYDEYYQDDLKSTKKIIEKFLKFEGRGKFDLYYHSSW